MDPYAPIIRLVNESRFYDSTKDTFLCFGTCHSVEDVTLFLVTFDFQLRQREAHIEYC